MGSAAILIRFIGTSEAVFSERDLISRAISCGLVGENESGITWCTLEFGVVAPLLFDHLYKIIISK